MKGDIVNNIPQFLSHLPIWKVNPLDKVKPKNVKPVKAHQYDVVDRIPNTWIEDAIKLRKQGIKFSTIAEQVNRSTNTVWRHLKKRGY